MRSKSFQYFFPQTTIHKQGAWTLWWREVLCRKVHTDMVTLEKTMAEQEYSSLTASTPVMPDVHPRNTKKGHTCLLQDVGKSCTKRWIELSGIMDTM